MMMLIIVKNNESDVGICVGTIIIKQQLMLKVRFDGFVRGARVGWRIYKTISTYQTI